jgi:beta-glucuronidase
MNESVNFQEHLHNREYRKKYISKKISPDNAIYDHFRKRELLDGLWNHHIDIYDTCLRAEWFKEEKEDDKGFLLPWDYDYDKWETINVPSTWNTEKPEYLFYEGSMVYTRTFKYENEKSERVVLKVGGAYHNSMVFLNQEFLGYHEGGDTPYYLEISDKLKEDNRILLVVNNSRTPERIPTIFTDWYNYGGLYRSVEIFRLPETFIKGFKINLIPDSDFKKIQVEVVLDGGNPVQDVRIRIPELDIDKSLTVNGHRGAMILEAGPELWSPESPRLYDVIVTAGNDEITERTGFREVKVDGVKIVLNGNSIKLRGVSSHEESVLNGKSVTDAEIRENFNLIKELNGNFCRLAHYPHTERAARLADEMGLLLWEEIPVYWAIQFENESTLINGRQQLSELIQRDYNRPSVIIWSVGNENPDSDERFTFMANLADHAHKLDGTRLVSAACLIDHVNNRINDRLAEKLDIIGINEYFGWYNPDFNQLEGFFQNSNPGKPVIITEFGAGAKAGHHGSRNDMFTEEYQQMTYEKQVLHIGKVDFIAGISPWILFDFRTPVRCNALQKGYNLKGLLSADKRHKKLAFYTLQDFFSHWDI